MTTPRSNIAVAVPLPINAWAVILGIVVAYVLAAELAKRWFYRSETGPSTWPRT